jgi:hypothetical protein
VIVQVLYCRCNTSRAHAGETGPSGNPLVMMMVAQRYWARERREEMEAREREERRGEGEVDQRTEEISSIPPTKKTRRDRENTTKNCQIISSASWMRENGTAVRRPPHKDIKSKSFDESTHSNQPMGPRDYIL